MHLYIVVLISLLMISAADRDFLLDYSKLIKEFESLRKIHQDHHALKRRSIQKDHTWQANYVGIVDTLKTDCDVYTNWLEFTVTTFNLACKRNTKMAFRCWNTTSNDWRIPDARPRGGVPPYDRNTGWWWTAPMCASYSDSFNTGGPAGMMSFRWPGTQILALPYVVEKEGCSVEWVKKDMAPKCQYWKKQGLDLLCKSFYKREGGWHYISYNVPFGPMLSVKESESQHDSSPSCENQIGLYPHQNYSDLVESARKRGVARSVTKFRNYETELLRQRLLAALKRSRGRRSVRNSTNSTTRPPTTVTTVKPTTVLPLPNLVNRHIVHMFLNKTGKKPTTTTCANIWKKNILCPETAIRLKFYGDLACKMCNEPFRTVERITVAGSNWGLFSCQKIAKYFGEDGNTSHMQAALDCVERFKNVLLTYYMDKYGGNYGATFNYLKGQNLPISYIGPVRELATARLIGNYTRTKNQTLVEGLSTANAKILQTQSEVQSLKNKLLNSSFVSSMVNKDAYLMYLITKNALSIRILEAKINEIKPQLFALCENTGVSCKANTTDDLKKSLTLLGIRLGVVELFKERQKGLGARVLRLEYKFTTTTGKPTNASNTTAVVVFKKNQTMINKEEIQDIEEGLMNTNKVFLGFVIVGGMLSIAFWVLGTIFVLLSLFLGKKE